MHNGRARSRPALTDLGVALGFAVILVLGTIIASGFQGDRFRALDFWAFFLVVLAAVTTLAFRRVMPIGALIAAMLTVSAYLLIGYPYGPVQLCMMIAMFEVARQRELRVSLLACGLSAIFASITVFSRFVGDVDSPAIFALAWMGWIVLPWSLGALVHVLVIARERSRRDLITRIALEERMKMARDVHDIAGHGFALAAMQAGVALLVLDEQPTQARRSLEAIQATSTQSLTDLREMLDAFHPHEPDSPVVSNGSSEGGLFRLNDLLDQVRAGGLPVELEREIAATTLAESIDAVGYRVVQESLTNVLKHAGPTKAKVRIVQLEQELLIQVLDYGRGSHQESFSPGRGIVGMRNRVEAVGGRWEAGPRESGGFCVTAYLPLIEDAR